MKNRLYWAYNLPLQVWPVRVNEEDEESPVMDYRLVNYMPRKERCCDTKLSDCLCDQTKEEFFETAALHFENLARLFREMKAGNIDTVYYHDDGMDG